MFRSEDFSQAGFLSILFAQAQEPLAFWDKKIGNSGRIKRIIEENEQEERLQCIEMLGNNVNSTYITSPPPGMPSLGISLPILVLIVKNLKRYFTYQVLILDDQNLRRRFRMTNIPGFNRKLPTVFTFPITLEEGWNELATNLSELCARVYGTRYIETLRIEIHPNCKLREVFFCERSETMKVRLAQPLVQSSLTEPNITEMVTCEKTYIRNNNNNNNNDPGHRQNKGVYKELANAVKSASAAMNNRGFMRGGSSLDSQNNGINSSSSTEHGNNENNKTEMNLGARLKIQMYFEKPPQKQQQPKTRSSSRTTSQSSSRKAFKDTKT